MRKEVDFQRWSATHDCLSIFFSHDNMILTVELPFFTHQNEATELENPGKWMVNFLLRPSSNQDYLVKAKFQGILFHIPLVNNGDKLPSSLNWWVIAGFQGPINWRFPVSGAAMASASSSSSSRPASAKAMELQMPVELLHSCIWIDEMQHRFYVCFF